MCSTVRAKVNVSVSLSKSQGADIPFGMVKHNELVSMNTVLVLVSELVKSSEHGGLQVGG